MTNINEADASEWFIAFPGEVKGPYNADNIRRMLDDCEIDGLTSVLRKGTTDWISLCKDEILKSIISTFEENHHIEEVKIEESKSLEKLKKQQYLKRRRERIDRGEFIISKKNYSVYITGLPKDVTSDELQSVFKKAGVIKIDPITTLPKVKIYRDENNVPKGDATITFVNRESVSLCLKYFDDYYFRPDVKIHVEEAQFKPKDKKRPVMDPELRKKKFLAAKYEAQRITSWSDEIDDGSGRRIVIAKPMFSLEDAKKYIKGHQFYETLRDEVYDEVIKYANVDKITPMARHPQGIVCLKFKTTKDAELFITAFKDRVFDGNKLQVYFYDGKTDLAAQCLPESDSENDSDYFKEDSPVVKTSTNEIDDYFNTLIEG